METIVARRTYDVDEILSVLKHPDILKTIAEDNSQNFDIDVSAECFIAADIDGELSALFIFSKTGAVVFDIHAHVLPAKRPHSRDLGVAILKYFFKCYPWAEKLNALIPVCYPNVVRYAESFGFKLEGVNRKSYVHHDGVIDQLYLGATQDEVLNGLY